MIFFFFCFSTYVNYSEDDNRLNIGFKIEERLVTYYPDSQIAVIFDEMRLVDFGGHTYYVDKIMRRWTGEHYCLPEDRFFKVSNLTEDLST